MTDFIKLSRKVDGGEIYVNRHAVTAIDSHPNGGCCVYVFGSDSWRVSESAEELQKLIDKKSMITFTDPNPNSNKNNNKYD